MNRSALARTRSLVDYLQATDNEIAIDTIAFDLAGLDPESTGYFPRPSKWAKHVGANRYPYRLAWLALAALWRHGLAAVFHFLELARYWLHSKMHRSGMAHLPSGDGYVLVLSSRVADIVRPPAIAPVPTCWLTLPWAPIRSAPEGCRRVELLSMLSGTDLWQSYRLALAATSTLARRRDASRWVLQSYTAFRWFAVRTALEKFDGRFVMAEHFDRWAILVDRVVRAKRRTAGSRPELMLVQHGEVGGMSPAAWTSKFYSRLKHRLRAVTSLYVFDQASEALFKKGILAWDCVSNGIDTRIYTPRIALQSSERTAEWRLLFVGHPLCERLHVHLLRSLKRHYRIQAFYKPHPMAGMSHGMTKYDWTIVQDKTAFPDVDLLISYPSTLVTEYSASGIPAAVHPLHLGVANAEGFAQCAKRQLDAIAAACRGVTPSPAETASANAATRLIDRLPYSTIKNQP